MNDARSFSSEPIVAYSYFYRMPVKDYYAMLEVEPAATQEEIKRSFRRLALRYHPDTNQGNRHSEAWFRELQEAYDTLTDPVKKEAYLQERWYWKSTGKPFARAAAFTPEMVVQQSRKLASAVTSMDHFRMDHAALRRQIAEVLRYEWLEMLQSFGDDDANDTIIENLLRSCEPLDYKHFVQLVPLFNIAEDILPQWKSRIRKYLSARRSKFTWDQYQAPIIIFLTILLCALIFIISSNG